MNVARTLEEPVERGDYVLFTHPRTWLRDLDPFARPKYPLTYAEQKRDQHLWGARLSYVMPSSQVDAAIAADGLFAGILAGNGITVVSDPNCPTDRAYMLQNSALIGDLLAEMTERIEANLIGTPSHLFMHPRTYAAYMKQEEERETRARVERRSTLRSSLWRALGLKQTIDAFARRDLAVFSMGGA